jgi:phosphate transport system permease protein
VFWPRALAQVERTDGSTVLGAPIRSDVNPDTKVASIQFKTGNRELDPSRQDFHWYPADSLRHVGYPPDAFILERVENGDFYGFLRELNTPSLPVPEQGDLKERFAAAVVAIARKRAAENGPISRELSTLSDRLEDIRYGIARAEYEKKRTPAEAPASNARLAELRTEEAELKRQSDELVAQQQKQELAIRENVALFETASGQRKTIPLVSIVRQYAPNAMNVLQKIGHYMAKVWELLTDNPRESNTEGGLFPAIFGTVMLVFLMAVFCFPLGVLAGVYLGEYAKQGPLVQFVRIAVNNLAGIPSIVYGIFGLGFFVYGVGGLVDHWFFPERVASNMPVFGTGGILWASLTLGLLTVPVVIVSTEEALRTIPRGLREGSYALGATKLQTLLRVLFPMASPGIMTGFILAMARAAGEVAPLMITGVVKLAPDLPVDGSFPFVHLDRKFMHLGFHIYDIGFQSPNVEASKPMVFVTTLLLLAIVLTMSSLAIWLRNRMRRRFQVRTI